MRLLIVEDEERVASFLDKGLRAHGYTVEWVQTGQDAPRRLTDPGISLVILDLGLPDLDGLDVLDNLRQRGSAVPVLVLTARGRMGDRIKGLNLGPDDYLGKPFAFEVLLARVQANLRPRAAVSPSVLQAGSIRIDLLRREATAGGGAVSLSARELSVLKALAGHPGQVLYRQEPLSMAWGMDFDTQTNLVDVYVGYLRRKLGESIIETPSAGRGTASKPRLRQHHGRLPIIRTGPMDRPARRHLPPDRLGCVCRGAFAVRLGRRAFSDAAGNLLGPLALGRHPSQIMTELSRMAAQAWPRQARGGILRVMPARTIACSECGASEAVPPGDWAEVQSLRSRPGRRRTSWTRMAGKEVLGWGLDPNPMFDRD